MTIDRPRHVTWSPDVAPVSRGLSPRLRQQTTKLSIHLVRRDERGMAAREKHFKGVLTAHIRKATKSALLTIYNRRRHRVFQLLISIPHERVRRIFDGERSWTVVDSGGPERCTMRLEFQSFGTVLWRDEDKIRRPDAKGFCLKWLAKHSEWSVRLSKDPRRNPSKRLSRGGRSKASRKRFHRSKSGGGTKKIRTGKRRAYAAALGGGVSSFSGRGLRR